MDKMFRDGNLFFFERLDKKHVVLVAGRLWLEIWVSHL